MNRRVVQRVVVLLLLLGGGAIVNVAVAWGCALQANAKSSKDPFATFDTPGVNQWRGHAPKKINGTPSNISKYSDFGVDAELVSSTFAISKDLIVDPLQSSQHLHFVRAGWPMYSVRGSRWVMANATSKSIDSIECDGAISLGSTNALNPYVD